jgi:hypothetical protein
MSGLVAIIAGIWAPSDDCPAVWLRNSTIMEFVEFPDSGNISVKDGVVCTGSDHRTECTKWPMRCIHETNNRTGECREQNWLDGESCSARWWESVQTFPISYPEWLRACLTFLQPGLCGIWDYAEGTWDIRCLYYPNWTFTVSYDPWRGLASGRCIDRDFGDSTAFTVNETGCDAHCPDVPVLDVLIPSWSASREASGSNAIQGFAGGDGLGSGAIAGIVIGCIVAAGAVVAIVIYVTVFKGRRSGPSREGAADYDAAPSHVGGAAEDQAGSLSGEQVHPADEAE